MTREEAFRARMAALVYGLQSIRELAEEFGNTGKEAKAVGESGVAMAAFLVEETLLAYCRAVAQNAKKHLHESGLDT